jgi:hypothetical protein
MTAGLPLVALQAYALDVLPELFQMLRARVPAHLERLQQDASFGS